MIRSVENQCKVYDISRYYGMLENCVLFVAGVSLGSQSGSVMVE